MKRLAVVTAIAVAGCAAGVQQFEPTERTQGRTFEGDKAAFYPLIVGGAQVGEAKVWSRGAYETDGQSVVQVGLEVHNTGSAPIELRPQEVTLDAHLADRGTVGGLRPTDPVERTFAPGQTHEASLVFPLPHGVSPGDLVALRLNWQVRVADQIYAQRTPFAEVPKPVYPYDPYGPYPYPSGYWGLGWAGFYGPVYRYYGPVHHRHHHHGHKHHGHHHHHGHHRHHGHGGHHHGHGGHHHR